MLPCPTEGAPHLNGNDEIPKAQRWAEVDKTRILRWSRKCIKMEQQYTGPDADSKNGEDWAKARVAKHRHCEAHGSDTDVGIPSYIHSQPDGHKLRRDFVAICRVSNSQLNEMTRPPQIALNPIGAGESRRLAVGEIASLRLISWFPDGKHLLLTGAAEGQPLRTYEMDTEGAKPEALGPADFVGAIVAPDGKRIAGRHAAAEAVVFDRDSQKLQVIPEIEPQEEFSKWTEDGRALITYSSTPSSARIYRIDVATGQRTLLHAIDPAERAGLMTPIRVAYAVHAKTYAYSTIRVLGNLYIVEGLE